MGPEFGVTFKLVYLNFSSNFDAVEDRQVDLVLTNPSVFACLEREFRAHPVLSLRKLRKVGDVVFELNRFYGAFIVRANSSITKISGITRSCEITINIALNLRFQVHVLRSLLYFT